MAKLLSASSLTNDGAHGLPVKNLGPAIAFYESVLGFVTTERDATSAQLKRDGAEVGLVVNSDHLPQEAGSVAFEVDDLDALHREIAERGGKPGVLDIEDWGGQTTRTFFVREHEDGYCFCFYCPMPDR